MTVDDLETDPPARWLREIKDPHDSSWHVDSVQSHGSVGLIYEAVHLRGLRRQVRPVNFAFRGGNLAWVAS